MIWREVLETVILTLLIFWVINSITGRFRIVGSSMQPTLQEGWQVIVNKTAYFFETPERGDIVVIESPTNAADPDLIKRVIAVAGDELRVFEGKVSVNGTELNEPYISAPTTTNGSWTVPEDHVFVMGDNRPNSRDSRAFSFLEHEEIVGKVWVIYWPIDQVRQAPHFDHVVAQPSTNAFEIDPDELAPPADQSTDSGALD